MSSDFQTKIITNKLEANRKKYSGPYSFYVRVTVQKVILFRRQVSVKAESLSEARILAKRFAKIHALKVFNNTFRTSRDMKFRVKSKRTPFRTYPNEKYHEDAFNAGLIK